MTGHTDHITHRPDCWSRGWSGVLFTCSLGSWADCRGCCDCLFIGANLFIFRGDNFNFAELSSLWSLFCLICGMEGAETVWWCPVKKQS